MISPDSCSKLVAGNYDILVNEPSPTTRKVLEAFLASFREHQLELEELAAGTRKSCSYAEEFRLLKEFSRVLKEDKSNLGEGEREYNHRKNRYKDIIPFSHTRVVLSSNPQELGQDYINANYVRGPSSSPKAYIAGQGPLPNTLIDFWRMIWECGVSVIVMACNQFESGEAKCELYWPDKVNTSKCYGNIQVSLVKVRQICPDLLIRKLSVKLLQPLPDESHCSQMAGGDLKLGRSSSSSSIELNNNNINNNSIGANNNKHATDNNKCLANNLSAGLLMNGATHTGTGTVHATNSVVNANGLNPVMTLPNKAESVRLVLQERTICQFHYTTWPDHGVPESVEPILELVRLMRDVQPTENKPILVHCSAGCGRTGTICCIDYVWGLLRRGKLDTSFNLCKLISEMRQQRMSMVQTLEQYILCHKAVATLFMNQLQLMDGHIFEHQLSEQRNQQLKTARRAPEDDEEAGDEDEELEEEDSGEQVNESDDQQYTGNKSTSSSFDEQHVGPVFI